MSENLEPASKRAEAEKIVKMYIGISAGVGVLPVPLVDQITIGALQGKMIYDLGRLYGVETSRYRTRGIVVAILGGAHAQWIPRYLMGYAAMLVPGLNTYGMFVARPVAAGAITYAVSRIFLRHFEAGGTLENLDVQAAKRGFGEDLKEGSRVAEAQLAK